MKGFNYNIKHCVIDYDAPKGNQILFDTDLQNCINMIFSEGVLGEFLHRVIDIDIIKNMFLSDAKIKRYNGKNFILSYAIYILKHLNINKVYELFNNESDYIDNICNEGSCLYYPDRFDIYRIEKIINCKVLTYEDENFDREKYRNNFIEKINSLYDPYCYDEIIWEMIIVNKTSRIIYINGSAIYPNSKYIYGMHHFDKFEITTDNAGYIVYDSRLENNPFSIRVSENIIPFHIYSNILTIIRNPFNIHNYIISEINPGE